MLRGTRNRRRITLWRLRGIGLLLGRGWRRFSFLIYDCDDGVADVADVDDVDDDGVGEDKEREDRGEIEGRTREELWKRYGRAKKRSQC